MHAPSVKFQDHLLQWLWSCCSTAGSFCVTSMQSSTLPTQPWTEVGVQQIDAAKAQPKQTFSWPAQRSAR